MKEEEESSAIAKPLSQCQEFFEVALTVVTGIKLFGVSCCLALAES